MKGLEKLMRWYFSKGALPYWSIMLLDCLIVILSGYVGWYNSIGGLEFAKHFWLLTRGLLISLLFFLVFFSFSTINYFLSVSVPVPETCFFFRIYIFLMILHCAMVACFVLTVTRLAAAASSTFIAVFYWFNAALNQIFVKL